MEKNNTPITIAFVDDHILLRDALATVINTFDNCRVILLASNGKDFIKKLEPGNLPRLVILDLNMQEMDGYETAKWLMNNHPAIPILVLTMYDSEIAMIRLLQTGVRGFLKKDIHPAELKLAIESVIESGYYYSYNSTGRLINLLKNNGPGNTEQNTIVLSEKEFEFLKLVSTDLTYKEIALQLNISPRTVDNYRDSLFLKLHVKSRVGLAMYAIKYGIVTISY
jgi:two-component system, NarL family, invasion response regulator UvrY